MSDNIDKDEIRRAIDRLQIEHPCNIAYDPIAFVNMEAVDTIKGCIDQIVKRMTEDTEINIICEFAKLYLDGVKPTVERPHGEWTPKQIIVGGNGAVFMHDGYECSCGRVVTQKENYCPDCGARMVSSKSVIENPCKMCSKYIGNMCEHVCEKRYEYVMRGGDEK